MGKLARLVMQAETAEREAPAPADEPAPAVLVTDDVLDDRAPVAPDVEQLALMRYQLDPRPDLVEDHRDWMVVLAVALYNDPQLHGLLHGLRCCGARLELRQSSKGPFYKIDYSALLARWNEQELRQKWLEPRRQEIKDVLDRALQLKKRVDQSFSAEARGEAS